MLTRSAAQVLTEAIQRNQRITVLTGAGISAESGIPTLRGPEGFWTIGSKVYHPQEAANRTQVLITVGTAGATNLPNHIVHLVCSNGGLLIDINLASNPFADLAMQSNRGFFIQRASSQALAEAVAAV